MKQCIPNCPFVKYDQSFVCDMYKTLLHVKTDSLGMFWPVRVKWCEDHEMKVIRGKGKKIVTLDGKLPAGE